MLTPLFIQLVMLQIIRHAVTERRMYYSTVNEFQTISLIYKTAALSDGIVIKVQYHYENSDTLKCNNRSLIIDGAT